MSERARQAALAIDNAWLFQDLKVAHPKLGARSQGRLGAFSEELGALHRGLAQQGVGVLDAKPPHVRQRLLDVRGGPEHDLQQGVLGPVLIEQDRQAVGLALVPRRQRLPRTLP